MTRTPAYQRPAPTPAELRRQIEHTRHELGVQDLAEDASVKARAQQRAGQLKDQALVKAGKLKSRAVKGRSQVQDKVPDSVKEKAAQATGRARSVAAQAARMWEEKAPAPLRAKTTQYAQRANDHRGVLLVVTSGVTVLWLVVRSRKN